MLSYPPKISSYKVTMTPEQSTTYESLLKWVGRLTNKRAIRRVGDRSIAISTDIGSVRVENQDRCVVIRKKNSHGRGIMVAALCDGMGGMESGADCASIAITSFVNYCAYSTDLSTKLMLENAVKTANSNVYSEYAGRGGATLSAFCIDDHGDVIGINVGDSRIFSFEDGQLKQLSTDDTLEGQLDDSSGVFTGRNELLQHVGIGSDIEPHIIPLNSIKSGGSLFLSTDGVHFMDNSLMASILDHAIEPATAVRRLVELSNWCGGSDNATSIVTLPYEELIQFWADSKLNVLEVWDPFGEIQFHFPIASTFKESTNKSDSESEDIKVTKPRKKRRAKAKKSPEATVSNDSKKNDELPEDKPQLDIKFNDLQGE